MFHSFSPVRAEIVEPQAIHLGFYLAYQSLLQYNPLSRVQDALKHRELNTLPIVLTRLCNSPQSCRTTIVCHRHIITYEHKHSALPCLQPVSSPDKRWISVYVSSQVPSKQECLHMKEYANRDLFIDEWMINFFPFPLLVCNEDGLSCLVIHENSS